MKYLKYLAIFILLAIVIGLIVGGFSGYLQKSFSIKIAPSMIGIIVGTFVGVLAGLLSRKIIKKK